MLDVHILGKVAALEDTSHGDVVFVAHHGMRNYGLRIDRQRAGGLVDRIVVSLDAKRHKLTFVSLDQLKSKLAVVLPDVAINVSLAPDHLDFDPPVDTATPGRVGFIEDKRYLYLGASPSDHARMLNLETFDVEAFRSSPRIESTKWTLVQKQKDGKEKILLDYTID